MRHATAHSSRTPRRANQSAPTNHITHCLLLRHRESRSRHLFENARPTADKLTSRHPDSSSKPSGGRKRRSPTSGSHPARKRDASCTGAATSHPRAGLPGLRVRRCASSLCWFRAAVLWRVLFIVESAWSGSPACAAIRLLRARFRPADRSPVKRRPAPAPSRCPRRACLGVRIRVCRGC